MAEEITNISLSTKKTFTIDGDLNRTIQLDISDMNIIVRIDEVYPDIQKLAVEAQERLANIKTSREQCEEDSDKEDITEVLKDIDKKMREKVDYIFSSNVSDVCVPDANMYDAVNGEFRFEHVIDVLTTLYANNIKEEWKKMQDRVKKHTAKYTNRRKK